MKLNQLLSKKKLRGSQYSALLSEYVATFKDKVKRQIFMGIRMEYKAENNYLDEPSRRGFRPLANTVPSYLEYFETTCGEYITNTFDIEATNASGHAKAHLLVEGKDWGEFSSLELLRLIDQIDDNILSEMYQLLPVRDGNQKWSPSTDKEIKPEFLPYAWETDEIQLLYPTTEKTMIILDDPNVIKLKEGAVYHSMQTPIDKRINTGSQKVQHFSGEISHTQRAEILRRLTNLKAEATAALSNANTTEVVKSKMTAELIFDYLHNGNTKNI